MVEDVNGILDDRCSAHERQRRSKMRRLARTAVVADLIRDRQRVQESMACRKPPPGRRVATVESRGPTGR